MDIFITLTLKDHCIETEAKNEFKRLMDRYFETTSGSEGLEARIELLREFITDTDFTKLRAGNELLSGGTDITVRLKKNGDRFTLEY